MSNSDLGFTGANLKAFRLCPQSCFGEGELTSRTMGAKGKKKYIIGRYSINHIFNSKYYIPHQNN